MNDLKNTDDIASDKADLSLRQLSFVEFLFNVLTPPRPTPNVTIDEIFDLLGRSSNGVVMTDQALFVKGREDDIAYRLAKSPTQLDVDVSIVRYIIIDDEESSEENEDDQIDTLGTQLDRLMKCQDLANAWALSRISMDFNDIRRAIEFAPIMFEREISLDEGGYEYYTQGIWHILIFGTAKKFKMAVKGPNYSPTGLLDTEYEEILYVHTNYAVDHNWNKPDKDGYIPLSDLLQPKLYRDLSTAFSQIQRGLRWTTLHPSIL